MATKTLLRNLLDKQGIKLAHAAKVCDLSVGAFNKLVNLGQWPKDTKRAALIKQSLQALLPEYVHEGSAPALPSTTKPAQFPTVKSKKGSSMLLRKHTLTQSTLAHFGLVQNGIARDPFNNDVREAADIYVNANFRYVRAALRDTIKSGGMLAVIGQSGAGKTTLRMDTQAHFERDTKHQYIYINPLSIIGMERDDATGKTMKAAQIATAIIRRIAPEVAPKRDTESRYIQLEQLLRESFKGGNRHVLMIEEAHCLPKSTLKHLKRFHEITLGFDKLLSIVLVGQTELRHRLSETDLDVREVTQRIQRVELEPLNADLSDYLAFKFKRAGLDINKVMDKAVAPLLEARLSHKELGKAYGTAKAQMVHSDAYPLAAANLLSAAMNMTAELGAPLVTPDMVDAVMKEL
jgi:type II secretory pathway predicted ATPase ExeA